jgi:hypothetical protein
LIEVIEDFALFAAESGKSEPEWANMSNLLVRSDGQAAREPDVAFSHPIADIKHCQDRG